MRNNREYRFWVYIMASASGTLYTGMTGYLEHRVWQHKNGLAEGFTKRYRCDRLVYSQEFANVFAAIAREDEIKGWVRRKKIALIEGLNPRWEDLAATWGCPIALPGETMAELDARIARAKKLGKAASVR